MTCGDLSATTPCAVWSIEDLYRHAIAEMLALGRAVDPRRPPPPLRDGYLPREQAFRDCARYAVDALATADDGAGGRVRWGAFGDLAPRELFDVHLTNTLLHTWDLAKAIRFDLDPPSSDALDIALNTLRHLPPLLRGAGKPFAPVVDFPASSDLEEALALSGRDPAWPASG